MPCSATTCYVVETFAPALDARLLEAETERISRAAAAAGVPLVYSVLIPGEETVFHVFAAEGREELEAALAAAGVEADRVSRALAAVPTATRARPRA